MSGGDRKALKKELRLARGMMRILADQAAEVRTRGEAMLRQADKLSCESWNERMWADGKPLRNGSSNAADSFAKFSIDHPERHMQL